MSKEATKWILASSFTLAALGFLWPFWPLSVFGIVLAALSGRYVFGVAIGVLFDVAYGAPSGTAHLLYFPFTLVALFGVAARLLGNKYLLSKDLPDTI